jgi:hypothetical protein
MVIPPHINISEQHQKPDSKTQTQWLTDCFFAFARSTGQET